MYILKSKKDQKYYIGQTNNVESRLKRHNGGEVKATRNRRPFELIYTEEYKSREQVMKREKYIKSLKGGNEFKKIISIRWGVAKW